MNYEQDIKIDDSCLDIECLDQAALFLKYAKHQAQTEKEKDEAKEKLDLTKAELDKEIRSDPAKFELEKVTDKVVENTIILQSEYKKATEEYLQAKFEWQTSKGAVESFNHRKDMLEALIKLHGQSYFAGPRVPRDLSKERELKKKEVNSNIAKKLVRRRG